MECEDAQVMTVPGYTIFGIVEKISKPNLFRAASDIFTHRTCTVQLSANMFESKHRYARSRENTRGQREAVNAHNIAQREPLSLRHLRKTAIEQTHE